MTARQSPPLDMSQGGARSLRAAIIASTCNDEGACIMCADCGHIFAKSRPLTDESEPVDNVTLSRALWHHLCVMGRAGENKRQG